MFSKPSVADSACFKIRRFSKYRKLDGILCVYVVYAVFMIIFLASVFVDEIKTFDLTTHNYIIILAVTIESLCIAGILYCLLKKPVSSIKVARAVSFALVFENVAFCSYMILWVDAAYKWYSVRHILYLIWWIYFLRSQRVAYYFSTDKDSSTKIIDNYFATAHPLFKTMKPWEYHKYSHKYDAMTYYLMRDLNTEATYFVLNDGKAHNKKLYSDVYYCYYIALAAGLRSIGIKNRKYILKDIDAIRSYSIKYLSSLTDANTESQSRNTTYFYFCDCAECDTKPSKALKEMAQRISLDYSYDYYGVMARFDELISNVINHYNAVKKDDYCIKQFITLNCMDLSMKDGLSYGVNEEDLYDMYYEEWNSHLELS